MTIEKFLERFQDVRKGRKGYQCKCPCHDDSTRSLSVYEAVREDGKKWISVFDHAGCSPRDILEAVGLTLDDLREDTEQRAIHAEQGLTVGQEAWREIRETGKGVREIGTVIQRAIEAMASMAETVRVTNERMGAIEEEMRGLRETIRTLEKVTPEQARAINGLIRQRARDLCEEYRMGVSIDHRADGKGQPGLPEWVPDPDRLAKLTAVIRTDVREMTGVRTAREIARCDWEAVVDYIEGWDDYEKIVKVKAGKRAVR